MEVLKDTTSSEQARIEALDELGKAIPDAVDDNGELKISYTQLGLAVEDYIEQLTIRAEIEATIELNSEKFSKRRKVRALEEMKDEAEKNKAIKKYLDEELSYWDTTFALGETIEEQTNFRRLSQTEKNKLRFVKLKQETEAEAQQIIDSIKKLQQKLKGINGDPSGGGGDGDARVRIFKEKTLELEKLEQRYRENSIDKDLQTNQEKIGQFQQNEFAKLDILEENFITRESLRLKNYIESVKNQKFSDKKKLELIADAEAKFTNEIKIAGEDRLKVEEQILLNSQLMRNKQIRESAEIARTEQENSFELDRQSKLNRGETQIKDLALLEEAKSQTILEQLLGTNRTEIRVTRDTLELKKSYAEDEIKRINDLLSNSEISQERRSQLENDLTVQQGIQTDTRIQILGLEEKAKDELVDSVAAGLSAVSSLMKKGTDAQKAVSIAATLISTYTSAQKAYESQLTATPDSPIRAVIAATSAVVQGLARVQAIRKVNPAGQNGSASSAPSVSAPSFNVVGASATNQLAQTVAGQVNAPLRAYVVGSDISDQQELDRSIISTAGIG